MNLEWLTVWLLWFVALYPPVTAAFWIAGSLIFRLYDETTDIAGPPQEGWPPITVLIPAFNEEQVIGTCVSSALAVDYPQIEILVLDDGSTDRTVEAAGEAAAGDPRVKVIRDPVNKGKAERLNLGLRRAANDLVITSDADTHLHPSAPKLLVARLLRSRLNAAVAGSPHVTNRMNLLTAMQVLEAASIIGLIRRTGAVRGQVGTVAGVLALLRRDRVLAVGGFRAQMATEDIDLTWRLLLAGWHTSYEPQALIGMQAPARMSALWMQRRRWARGQGETLHDHLGSVIRWQNRALWPLALESIGSLIWVSAWLLALTVATIDLFIPGWDTIFGFAFACSVAIAVICMLQTMFALSIEARYDNRALRVLLLGPLYPMFFWAISALAALRAEVPALFRGPREQRVAWDIPRDRADTSAI